MKMAREQVLTSCRGVKGTPQPAGRGIIRYAPDSEAPVVGSRAVKALRPFEGNEALCKISTRREPVRISST